MLETAGPARRSSSRAASSTTPSSRPSHCPSASRANPNPVNCRGERHRALPYKDGEAKRAVEDWRRFAETPVLGVLGPVLCCLTTAEAPPGGDRRRYYELGDAPRPWVAAHLRRGDACRDGAYMGRTCSSGDDYARACCDAGRKYGFGTLIVATDSSSALAELTAALAERRCPFTVKATSDTSVDDKTRESARVEDLLESNVLDSAKEFAGVLVDVFLLASGDVYIGKFTSNLDRLAYATRRAEGRRGALRIVGYGLVERYTQRCLMQQHTDRKAPQRDAPQEPLRNITRKKLQVDECRAPRAVAELVETAGVGGGPPRDFDAAAQWWSVLRGKFGGCAHADARGENSLSTPVGRAFFRRLRHAAWWLFNRCGAAVEAAPEGEVCVPLARARLDRCPWDAESANVFVQTTPRRGAIEAGGLRPN